MSCCFIVVLFLFPFGINLFWVLALHYYHGWYKQEVSHCHGNSDLAVGNTWTLLVCSIGDITATIGQGKFCWCLSFEKCMKLRGRGISHVRCLCLLFIVACLFCGLCPSVGTSWLNVTAFALALGSSSWAAFTLWLPARWVLTGGQFHSRAWLTTTTVVVVVVVCVSAQCLHDGAERPERPLAFRASWWSPLLPMMPFGRLCLLIGALVDLLIKGDPQFQVLRSLPARRGRLQGALGAGGNFLAVSGIVAVGGSVWCFTVCSVRVAGGGGGVVTDAVHRLWPTERKRQFPLSCGRGGGGGEVLLHHQVKVVWHGLLLCDWQVGWPLRSQRVWRRGSLIFTFLWWITVRIWFTQRALHDLFESG